MPYFLMPRNQYVHRDFQKHNFCEQYLTGQSYYAVRAEKSNFQEKWLSSQAERRYMSQATELN